MDDLIDLSLGELLGRFGAGSHKPGSGSAAAVNALISCEMLITVIGLTKKKDKYREVHKQLDLIDSQIKRTLRPRLRDNLQKDSVQFDRVIQLRKKRDLETNQTRRKTLQKNMLKAQALATDIALEIAEDSITLGKNARHVFDVAFEYVRGDSAVAISSALASVMGALGIVYLNLLSYEGGSWALGVRQQTDKLLNSAEELQNELLDRVNRLRYEKVIVDLDELRRPEMVGRQYSNSDIEKIVVKIQARMWQEKDAIWKSDPPQEKLASLKPLKALNIVGYKTETEGGLGQFEFSGQLQEVAGILNRSDKLVSISEQFPLYTRNFTTAHELGHILLHNVDGVHRDRALDGGPSQGRRPRMEAEADKFAAYFLMPKELVIERFRAIFGIKLTISEESSIALGYQNSNELRDLCDGRRRVLSRIVAKATKFGGNYDSLAHTFNVADEAMAIRLEELGLVEL